MNKYHIKYVDKEGDLQDYKASGKSMAHVTRIVHNLCPDCRRITSITELTTSYE